MDRLLPSPNWFMFLENLRGIRPAEPGRSIRPELEGLGPVLQQYCLVSLSRVLCPDLFLPEDGLTSER